MFYNKIIKFYGAAFYYLKLTILFNIYIYIYIYTFFLLFILFSVINYLLI
jgi:hypothetical protein